MSCAGRQCQLKPMKSKDFFNKAVNDTLAQEFAMKEKIVEGGVKFDIFMFGNESLYNYGPRDKEIPSYRRLER